MENTPSKYATGGTRRRVSDDLTWIEILVQTHPGMVQSICTLHPGSPGLGSPTHDLGKRNKLEEPRYSKTRILDTCMAEYSTTRSFRDQYAYSAHNLDQTDEKTKYKLMYFFPHILLLCVLRTYGVCKCRGRTFEKSCFHTYIEQCILKMN